MWQSLHDAGVVFRLGRLILIVAGPGTGKSAFTLTLALRAKVSALYFSADSDAYEQLVRAVCITSETTVEAARRAVLANDVRGFEAALAAVPIRLVYDANPSLDTIELSVEAYEEVYGEYPALIVIDNVTNVRAELGDGERASSGLEALMDYLSGMARETGACVIGLHHVQGAYNDADKPIPLSGVKDQISRVPEMVLSLFRPDDETLGVSAVKNRGGKPDPSGKSYVELDFDGGRMKISDPAPRGQSRPAEVEPTQPPPAAERAPEDIWT